MATGAVSEPAAPSGSWTPRLIRTLGRAEGLAAARGSRLVSPEDYLVAILLGPGGYASLLLDIHAGSIDCLAARLVAAGHKVPGDLLVRESSRRG